MTDLFFVAGLIVFFGLCALYCLACERIRTMVDIIVGLIGVILIVYLFVTVLRPEWF